MEKKNLLDKLDELVLKSKSFQKIMQDGVVEDSEIEEQEALVEGLIEHIEKTFSEQDFKLVAELLAEVTVLQTVFYVKNAQKGE